MAEPDSTRIKIATKEMVYVVNCAPKRATTLGRVILSADTVGASAFRFLDFFSVPEARALAAALVSIADQVEEPECDECEHHSEQEASSDKLAAIKANDTEIACIQAADQLEEMRVRQMSAVFDQLLGPVPDRLVEDVRAKDRLAQASCQGLHAVLGGEGAVSPVEEMGL